MGNSDFVAVDWGTSQFRLWGLSTDGKVLGKREGPYGMAKLTPSEYVSVLEENISALEIDAECPVIVCGMAGAAQGWCEAPYMQTSRDLSSLAEHAVRVPDIERVVHILPGVKQVKPANVMRGEETQLLGLLHTQADFNGVVCLPGTHSKWIDMRDGNIQHFTTHMTGELFALLSEQSVLRHSVKLLEDASLAPNPLDQWDQSAFENALNDVLEKPECAVEQLFSVRACDLLEHTPKVKLRSRLSGLLIGLELAATRQLWTNQTVALIGGTVLCQHYASALNTLNIASQCFDSELLTLSGLVHAFHHLETTNHAG